MHVKFCLQIYKDFVYKPQHLCAFLTNYLLFYLLLIIYYSFHIAASTTEGYFDGNAYAEYLLHKTPIKSSFSTVQLSFSTLQPNGMILHGDSKGDEFGDYFTLELIGGKLR